MDNPLSHHDSTPTSLSDDDSFMSCPDDADDILDHHSVHSDGSSEPRDGQPTTQTTRFEDNGDLFQSKLVGRVVSRLEMTLSGIDKSSEFDKGSRFALRVAGSDIEKSGELGSDHEDRHVPELEVADSDRSGELDSDHEDGLLPQPQAFQLAAERSGSLDSNPEEIVIFGSEEDQTKDCRSDEFRFEQDDSFEPGTEIAEDDKSSEVRVEPEETLKPGTENAEEDRSDELSSPERKLDEFPPEAGSILSVGTSSLALALSVDGVSNMTSPAAEAVPPSSSAEMMAPATEATSANSPTGVSLATLSSPPKAFSPLKPIKTKPSMMMIPTPLTSGVATNIEPPATMMPKIKPPLLITTTTSSVLTTLASTPAMMLKPTVATTKTVTTTTAAASGMITTRMMQSFSDVATTQSAMVMMPTMKTAKVMLMTCICEHLMQVIHEGCRVQREMELVNLKESMNVYATFVLRTRESLDTLRVQYGTSYDYECPVHGIMPVHVQQSRCCFCAAPASLGLAVMGGQNFLGSIDGSSVALSGLSGPTVALDGVGGVSLESVRAVRGADSAGRTNLRSYSQGGLSLDVVTDQGISNVGGANISLDGALGTNLLPGNVRRATFDFNDLVGANLFAGRESSASFGQASDVSATKARLDNTASTVYFAGSGDGGGATAAGRGAARKSASVTSMDASSVLTGLSGLSEDERKMCNSASTKLVKMMSHIEKTQQEMFEHVHQLQEKFHRMEANKQEVETVLRYHVAHLRSQLDKHQQLQEEQLRLKHSQIKEQVIATCTQVNRFKDDLTMLKSQVEDKLNRICHHDVTAAGDDDVAALTCSLQALLSAVALPEIEMVWYRVDVPQVTSDDIHNLSCRVVVDNSSKSSNQQDLTRLSASQTTYQGKSKIYPDMTRQDKTSQIRPDMAWQDNTSQIHPDMTRQDKSCQIHPDKTLQDKTSEIYPDVSKRNNSSGIYPDIERTNVAQGCADQRTKATSCSPPPSSSHPSAMYPSPVTSSSISELLQEISDQHAFSRIPPGFASASAHSHHSPRGYSPSRPQQPEYTPHVSPTPSPSSESPFHDLSLQGHGDTRRWTENSSPVSLPPSSSSPLPFQDRYRGTPVWPESSSSASHTPLSFSYTPYQDPYADLYNDPREWLEDHDHVSQAHVESAQPFREASHPYEEGQESSLYTTEPSFSDHSSEPYYINEEWLEQQLQHQQQQQELQQQQKQKQPQLQQQQQHQQKQQEQQQQKRLQQPQQKQQQQPKQPTISDKSKTTFSWADLASGRRSSHDGGTAQQQQQQQQQKPSSSSSTKKKRPEMKSSSQSTNSNTGQDGKLSSRALPTKPSWADLASGRGKSHNTDMTQQKHRPSSSSSLVTKDKHSDMMASNQSISSCTERPVTPQTTTKNSWAQVAAGGTKGANKLQRNITSSTSSLAKKDKRKETMSSNQSLASSTGTTTSTKKTKAAVQHGTDGVKEQSAPLPNPKIPVKITIPPNPATPKQINLRGQGKDPKGLAPDYNGHLWVVYGHEDPHLDVVDENGKKIMSERIGGNAMDVACFDPESVLVSCISPRCLKLLNSKLQTTWSKELDFTQRGIGVGSTGIAVATSDAIYWLAMDGGNSQWIVSPPANDEKDSQSSTSPATKIGRLCSCDVVIVQGNREIVCVADVEALKVRLYEKKRLDVSSSGGSSGSEKTKREGFSRLVAFSCTLKRPGKGSPSPLVPISVSAHPSGFLGVLDATSMSVVIVDIAGQQAKAVSVIRRDHLCTGIPSVIAFAIHSSENAQDPKLWVGTSSGHVFLVPLKFEYE